MFSDLICNRGTILISGGLGGLSIEMSKWMIKERGVKRIVLMSRRNIEELEQNSVQFNDWMNLKQIAQQYNAVVEVMKASVIESDQVVEVIRRINENNAYPVRGIIHSAMVLHDCLLKNMTQETLSKVMQPKICGAWNLHYATRLLSCPISFFIMLSSIGNHIANLGQSNYNAGNNFLDALAYWRLNCRNLPAMSISLPAISGAGYIHKNPGAIVQLMHQKGIHLMPAIYVFKMIEQLHLIQQQQKSTGTDHSSPVMFVVNWKTLLSTTKLPSRLTSIANEYMLNKEEEENQEVTSIVHSNDDKNQSSLSRPTLDIHIITTKIRLSVAKLFGALNVDRIDLDTPLIHQGMDSLIAVELYNWLLKEMSVSSPLAELLQGMSINDLASYVQTKLLIRQTNSNVEPNNNTDDKNNNNKESLRTETDNLNSKIEKNDTLESQYRHTGTSLITPLYYSEFKPPLFCIHDIIGLSQTFIQFASKMSQVYQKESPSIYAFRASGYESGEPYLQSIEVIAEEYISQMKRIQPIGPYNLLGYSFGGLVANEMVRQLHNYHNETVRSLILIDPPTLSNEHVTIPNGLTENQYWSFQAVAFIYSYLMKQETHFQDSINTILKSSVSEEQQNAIAQDMIQKALTALKQRFYTLKQYESDSSENQQHLVAEKMFEIINIQCKAAKCYTYDSAIDSNNNKIENVIMFTLKQDNDNHMVINQEFFMITNKNQQQKRQIWKTLLPNLKIEQIEGTHYKLLQAPIVDVIVNKLKTMNIL